MKEVLVRMFKYILAIFISICFVLVFNTIKVVAPNTPVIPIFAILTLGAYYFTLFKIARIKNRSPLIWVLLGTFLSPFVGFSILLFGKKNKENTNIVSSES
ncbi:hypothetical protein [Vibrio mexicanus]|uniref:hypothetical protein n=1 Tax=Vibrio mexicanus TaxID=1004326 RepID=UPI00063C4E96|nr:hypothetical protein [Vibrio mexicanus]